MRPRVSHDFGLYEGPVATEELLSRRASAKVVLNVRGQLLVEISYTLLE